MILSICVCVRRERERESIQFDTSQSRIDDGEGKRCSRISIDDYFLSFSVSFARPK